MQTQAPAADPSPTLGGGSLPFLSRSPSPPPAEQRPVPELTVEGCAWLGGLCILPLGPPYVSLLLSTLTVVASRVEH